MSFGRSQSNQRSISGGSGFFSPNMVSPKFVPRHSMAARDWATLGVSSSSSSIGSLHGALSPSADVGAFHPRRSMQSDAGPGDDVEFVASMANAHVLSERQLQRQPSQKRTASMLPAAARNGGTSSETGEGAASGDSRGARSAASVNKKGAAFPFGEKPPPRRAEKAASNRHGNAPAERAKNYEMPVEAAHSGVSTRPDTLSRADLDPWLPFSTDQQHAPPSSSGGGRSRRGAQKGPRGGAGGGLSEPLNKPYCAPLLGPVRKRYPVVMRDASNRQSNQTPPPPGEVQSDLEFSSDFESGNLRSAHRVLRGPTGDGEEDWKPVNRPVIDYELEMRHDLHTTGHTQWFFFRVRGAVAKQRYRFTLTNFAKSDSLYLAGMQPLVYSKRQAAEESTGWHRSGDEIWYFRNDADEDAELVELAGGTKTKSYSLTFVLEFAYSGDEIYVAYSLPYTYSELQLFLKRVCSQKASSGKVVRRQLLCRTLAGNRCDLLTITSPVKEEEGRPRQAVVISARVHPGESPASWAMHGLIEFLTGTSAEAIILRSRFNFYVVPMLNPDGVINGNYRCSLAGVDLNRKWHTPSKSMHPTVFHLKKLIQTLQKERVVAMYCDLHSHSRQKGCFMYGCLADEKPGMKAYLESSASPSSKRMGKKKSLGRGDQLKLHDPRVFSYMLMQRCPTMFSYKKCDFRVQKAKECTARVVVCKELKVRNSYTMEISFCGQVDSDEHFSLEQLLSVGKSFGLALIDLYTLGDAVKLVKDKLAKTQAKARRLAEAAAASAAASGANGEDGAAIGSGRRSAGSRRKRRGGRRLRKGKRSEGVGIDAKMPMPVPMPDAGASNGNALNQPFPPDRSFQRTFGSSAEFDEDEEIVGEGGEEDEGDEDFLGASDEANKDDDEEAEGVVEDGQDDSLAVALDGNGTIFSSATFDELLAHELDVEEQQQKLSDDEMKASHADRPAAVGRKFGGDDDNYNGNIADDDDDDDDDDEEELIDDLIYADIPSKSITDDVSLNGIDEDVGSTGTGGESDGELSDAELAKAMRELRPPSSVRRPVSASSLEDEHRGSGHFNADVNDVESSRISLGSVDDIDSVGATRPVPSRMKRELKKSKFEAARRGVKVLGGDEEEVLSASLLSTDYELQRDEARAVGVGADSRLDRFSRTFDDDRMNSMRPSAPQHPSFFYGASNMRDVQRRATFLPVSNSSNANTRASNSRSPHCSSAGSQSRVQLSPDYIATQSSMFCATQSSLSPQSSLEQFLTMKRDTNPLTRIAISPMRRMHGKLDHHKSRLQQGHDQTQTREQHQQNFPRLSKKLSGVGSRALM